ncbi:AAA family ATPase [Nocardia sp. NPDC050408]|uniref:AAA family ATPase n=1 Tax=Nocardia sp. NPDC050408 TaxID=3364319 RepID=UPI00378A4575
MRPARQPHPFTAAKFVMTHELDRIAAATDTGVTIVCGFPASGKSTAARHLTDVMGAVLIDKDSFATELEESVMTELTGDPHDRDSSVYARVINPHIYSALIRHALITGHRAPVVVDAPFLGHVRGAAQQGISLAEYIGSSVSAPARQVQTIWVSAEPDQIRERMARRGAPRDAGKLANWDAYRTEVLEQGTGELAAAVVDYVVQN